MATADTVRRRAAEGQRRRRAALERALAVAREQAEAIQNGEVCIVFHGGLAVRVDVRTGIPVTA
jgi:hypothetical protein